MRHCKLASRRLSVELWDAGCRRKVERVLWKERKHGRHECAYVERAVECHNNGEKDFDELAATRLRVAR